MSFPENELSARAGSRRGPILSGFGPHSGYGDLDKLVKAMGPPSRRDARAAAGEPGDLRAVLPHIECPTLVLRGGESIVTTPEGIRALAEGLPKREIREIEGGSHMLLLEDPDVVVSAVRDFLRRHISLP